ncbi:MAG: DUF2505 domain-containing protein [Candidatus Nanopelagicales bacterium]|jgi:hypothetical protein|nr:DUF2505 domain-containing protein [Candidatus Nanopelagicales bacterium]
MATSLDFEQTYPADPETVMAMLTNPDLIKEKMERTGSMATTVDVKDSPDGGFVITTTRVLPSKVPAAAAAFVGETLNVTEVQTWSPAAADGARSGTVAVDFGAPITFKGTMHLGPSPDGTVVSSHGDIKAGIPFVGGMIETGAADQTRKYLKAEETIGREFLAR